MINCTKSQLNKVHNRLKSTHCKMYFSTRAKNIKTRLRNNPSSFTKLTNKKIFIEKASQAIKGLGYIHISLGNTIVTESKQAKADNLFICIDLDSKNEGYQVFNLLMQKRVNIMQDMRVPLMNKTPNGYHFFFFDNREKINRSFEKKLAIGIDADILTNGYVTICGPGYQLLGFDYAPHHINFPQLPYFLYPAGKRKKSALFYFIQNKIKSSSSEASFQNHFQLSPKMVEKSKKFKYLKKRKVLYKARKLPYPCFLDLQQKILFTCKVVTNVF